MDAKKLNEPGVKITPVSGTDVQKIKTLQPQDWPDIGLAYAFYADQWFCSPIKLEQGDQLIGVGCLIQFEKTCWLSQIIISESFRNQGWGRLFTQHLIEMAPPSAQTISLLATPMGEPVYTKLGFKPVGVYQFYRSSETSGGYTSKQVRPFVPGFEEQVLQMDYEVSGENRSYLIRQFMDEARICTEGDELLGYFLPKLGDGLIIAKDQKAGMELLKFKLNRKKFNVLPLENEWANQYLTEQGFDAYRRATRMIIGLPIPYHPELIYSRIGGNLG